MDGQKTCSPTTICKKESCLSKTGYDLPLFFSGICHYLYNKPGGWKQWDLSAGSNLHPVSPRRVERKGGHLGPVYQGGNGEALGLKCLHLQVKACIWGILESLIRANFVWRRANARFIEMAGSCALIGKGGSALFPLSSLSWWKWDPHCWWKEPRCEGTEKNVLRSSILWHFIEYLINQINHHVTPRAPTSL